MCGNKDLELGKEFLDLTQKAQAIKGKKTSWTSSNEKLLRCKDPEKRMKNQSELGENVYKQPTG